jgi:creatinine amidohydrolase
MRCVWNNERRFLMDEKQKGINIFEETMAHMTYLQIEEAAREGRLVLFPTGVIEEHGPHLPLAVDVYGAYLQSRTVRSELEKMGIKVMIAPPFYWGINTATGAFGGSFTCREETVIAVLTDAMANLKKWGFDRVFFLNHHMDGSHVQALDKAIRKAREEFGIQAFWIVDQFMAKRLGFKGDEPHLLLHKTLMDIGTSSPYLNIHAETYETSFMLHYLPHLVNSGVLRTLKPTNLTIDDLLVWRKGGAEARKVTPQGYFGDPATANPEMGRKEIELYGRIAAEVIEDLLRGRYSPP